MTEDEILGQVALGYSAFIDRNRSVTATRLTVFPLRPDVPLDVSQLLSAVGSVWPAEGGRVSLNITSESLLHDLLNTTPTQNLMVEVPAFMAVDPENSAALVALHAHGTVLLIKGRPLQELPREVLPCFKYSIIDLADDRRNGTAAPAGVTRTIDYVMSGIHTPADMEEAFHRRAVAVLGWPIGDEVEQRPKGSKPIASPIDLQTVVELIRQVDAEESPEKLEATLKRDPSLGFKVLRFINSAAFGLTVEVSSFRHALMLLGYKRLKRWLALLLATASKEPNLRAAMFASVRRGLLMEELAPQLNLDPRAAYTSGLLRSVGKIVLDVAAQKDFRNVSPAALGDTPLLEWERDVFGPHNLEVAAAVLRSWRFSIEVIVPIRDHYLHRLAVDPVPATRSDPMAAATVMLHLAAALAETRGLAIPGEKIYWDGSIERLERELNLDQTELQSTVDRAYTRFEKMRAALG